MFSFPSVILIIQITVKLCRNCRYTEEYPMIYELILNGTYYLDAPDNYLEVNKLRLHEVTFLQLDIQDSPYMGVGLGNFSARFNDYNSSHEENRLALLLTTILILLLFVAMAVFVYDAKKLSQQINIPLDQLSKQVH